jgi:hypothetical protein
MKNVIGSSLFIIALKSRIGFTGDLQAGIEPARSFAARNVTCNMCQHGNIDKNSRQKLCLWLLKI